MTDEYGLTPLDIAVAGRNRRPIVELLIVRGADINRVDPDGNTPLISAVMHGQLQVLIALC